MSFFEKAKQAAADAADKARAGAEQARQMATEQAKSAQSAVQRTSDKLSDPATAEKAKQALGRAKKGISTAIDRIDPGVLADMVIKATALQERANNALRAKGSLYRIAEISIGASIPPSVSFAIGRIDDPTEVVTGDEVASTHLVMEGAVEEGTIIALDGSMIDEAALVADTPVG